VRPAHKMFAWQFLGGDRETLSTVLCGLGESLHPGRRSERKVAWMRRLRWTGLALCMSPSIVARPRFFAYVPPSSPQEHPPVQTTASTTQPTPQGSQDGLDRNHGGQKQWRGQRV